MTPPPLSARLTGDWRRYRSMSRNRAVRSGRDRSSLFFTRSPVQTHRHAVRFVLIERLQLALEYLGLPEHTV